MRRTLCLTIRFGQQVNTRIYHYCFCYCYCYCYCCCHCYYYCYYCYCHRYCYLRGLLSLFPQRMHHWSRARPETGEER